MFDLGPLFFLLKDSVTQKSQSCTRIVTIYLFMFMCVMCIHICVMTYIQGTEASLEELVLFFHYADPGALTQVLNRFGRWQLYPPSHFSGP